MEKFYLYNTLTKRVDEFVPREAGKVSMYTCGPTVYHFAHIGNLRSYIMEDVLEKFLRYIGYDVKRVMNITDVGHLSSDGDTGEDKMVSGAKREGAAGHAPTSGKPAARSRDSISRHASAGAGMPNPPSSCCEPSLNEANDAVRLAAVPSRTR